MKILYFYNMIFPVPVKKVDTLSIGNVIGSKSKRMGTVFYPADTAQRFFQALNKPLPMRYFPIKKLRRKRTKATVFYLRISSL